MNTATATKVTRTNTYAGSCAKCGGHVAAQAGHLGGKVNGRWTVTHSACPQTAPTARQMYLRTAPRTRKNYGRHTCHLGQVCDECA